MVTPAAERQRTKRPDSRRQELLDAALRLVLDEGGITSFRVADVTKAAGAAKGTFYLYFQTKDELVAALQEQFVDELISKTEERVAEVADQGWDAQVGAYVEAGVDFYVDNVQIHHVLFHGVSASASMETSIVRWLADFISDGVVEGAFRVRDPWLAASFFYNAVHGVLDGEYYGRGTVDRGRVVASIVDLMTKALAPVAGGDRSRRRPGR